MRNHSAPWRPIVAAVLAAAGIGAAQAGPKEASPISSSPSPASRYEAERAMCMRGETGQDRQTCLREAGAALEQARRGGFTTESPAVLAANRMRRCDPLPEEQRRDCVARMQGEGTASGSVTGGGIYRELVTIVPGGDETERAAPQ